MLIQKMKIMKLKRINIYYLLFVMALGFVSCSDDDEPIAAGDLPVAEFTASDDDWSIEVGEVVTFTDASENSPSLYTWRIEGGNPTYSNQKSVEVEFVAEGSQAITLTVRNDAGADEITKFIEVKPLDIPDLDIIPLVKMRFENDLINEGSVNVNGTGGSNIYEPRSKYGGLALKFTGSEDVTLSGYTGINGANTRTVACWVKTDWNKTSGLVHWGAAGTKSRSSFKFQGSGQIRYEFQGGGVTGVALVNDNEWHHVAYTYDGNTIRIYVDGVEDATLDAVIDTGVAGETDVNIGSQLGGSLFQGIIDDVRIYEEVLTPDQIKFLSEIM
mgnify:CR=1 FL=1